MTSKIKQAIIPVEEQIKIMADSAPVLIWISGVDKLCYFFNAGWLRFLEVGRWNRNMVMAGPKAFIPMIWSAVLKFISIRLMKEKSLKWNTV